MRVIVTGATNGIGREAARTLATSGAEVIVVGRSTEKIEATRAMIDGETYPLLCDFSSQAAIRAAAREVQRRFDSIDVLINNAAVGNRERRTTIDGLEEVFAVNHLGYFLFTNLLIDSLEAAEAARVINVSSVAHRFYSVDFDNLQHETGFGPLKAYGRSKACNVLFTYELARRLESSPVTVNAVHPGIVRTGLGANNTRTWDVVKGLGAPFMRGVGSGADTIVYLATDPAVAGISGRYFARRKARSTSAATRSLDAAARLWDLSLDLTGHPFSDPRFAAAEGLCA